MPLAPLSSLHHWMTEYLSLRRRPEFFNLWLRLRPPNFVAENFHLSRRLKNSGLRRRLRYSVIQWMSPSLCKKVIKSCKSMIGNQIITRQEFVKMHLCGSCVTKMLAHNNCRAKFSMTIMYQYLKHWPAWRLAFIFMVYCNSYLAAKVFFALRQEVWYWPHALISAFIRGGSLGGGRNKEGGHH